MSRTITAMFDSRSDAERAREKLMSLGITDADVRLVDQSSTSGTAATTSSTTGHAHDRGFWQSIKDMFVPDEDAHGYAEGIRRGGTLLTARVDETQADRVIDILDDDGTVDFEQRQQGWRNEGWTGGALTDTDTRGGTTSNLTGADTDERIPIVDEQLRVGKREVNRGGVRVRSYIVEEPVSEQVRLREEHVSVERVPVDRRVDVADGDLLRERTIEVSEVSEEAVVGKEAYVREEVVVRKTADERVETVSDTVRRTEVDVDDLDVSRGSTTGREGLGSNFGNERR